MFILLTMLLSQFPYSIMNVLGLSDIPVKVYAEESTSGMVLGSSALETSVNTKDAQTVYYAGTAWRVIAYNGTGNNALKSSTSNIMTLLAPDNLSSVGTAKFSSNLNNVSGQQYSNSILKSKIDTYWSGNTFDSLEKTAVVPRTLTGGASYTTAAPYTNGVAGSAVNNAYLWPLSTQEAYYLGHGDNTTGSTDDTNANELRKAGTWWWLRSPGVRDMNMIEYEYRAAYVGPNGNVGYYGGFVNIEHGVRPAFNLNLSSILLTSAAVDGKQSNAIGEGSLKAVESYTGTEWKLTILDDEGHSGFTASRVDSGSVLPGGKIIIQYSGAKTGENEYVSVILMEKDSDKILYYGHLAQNESDAAAILAIPEDIAEGEYTIGVFSEQCNGNNKTDYASEIITLEDIEIVEHTHSFTYSVGIGDEANKITATCTNTESDCPLNDGNGNHTISLTIAKPDLTTYGVTESASAKLTGLDAFNTATSKSIAVSNIEYEGRDGTSYNKSTTAPTDAGKYRASITVENVTAYVDYEIDKADGSISYSDENVTKTFDLGNFTNPLSKTGDGEVTYESSDTGVATVDGTGKVTFVNVGTVTITATVADSNNYVYAIKTASYDLTVNKGSGSISYTTTSIDKVYGNEPFTNELNKTGDGTVTYASNNENVATVDAEGKVTIVGVGETTITATVADTDNCTYTDKTASYTLTVSKGDQTITAEEMNLTYGVSGNVGATTNGDGTISYAVKSGSENYIDVDANGTVTVKSVPTDANTEVRITVTASSTEHYNEAIKEVAVTINKASLTITANSYNIVIGEAIPDLTSSDSYNVTGLVGGDSFSTPPTLNYQQNGNNVSLSGAASAEGTYDIVPSGADAGGNYTINYNNGTLTIGKVVPTVVAPTAQDLTYNGEEQALVNQGTTTGGEMQYAIGSESEATGAWSTAIPKATNAGTYYVWYKVVGNDTYGDIAPTAIPATISPKSIANANVTLDATEFTYDNQEHSVSVTGVVLENGTSLTAGTDYSVDGDLVGMNKGIYTVRVAAAETNPNYTGEVKVTWNIGLATPSINATPTSTPITYGQTLGESILNGGEASVPGSFSWKVPDTKPSVSDSDTTLYEVIFTPDNENYAPVTLAITVTVNKAESPAENPAPTPKEDLTDNGHPQELINPVTVTGGTIEYVIGTDDSTPPTSGWGPNVPTAAAPGTYYIWYKVVGDENHQDSVPKCIIVTIAEAPVPSDIPSGYVKDVTGTSEATCNYSFGQRIVNNGDLKTLLSLSDDEVSQGTKVWLDVTDISANVSSEDKTLIDGAKGDYTVGLYLDINLFKKIGNNDAVKVTETNGKVKISILIPENLRKSGRTFEIIRIHEGQTTVIPGTYDENTHIFTFETDRFSTYAIAYKDGASNGNTAINTNTSTGNNTTGNATVDVSIPKTDGTTGLGIWFVLLFASLGVLVALVFVRVKRED